jgi:hypothetical protein
MEKIKCPCCNKEYTKMGLGTHIWKSHGEGRDHDPNRGYKDGSRKIWNKGLSKEIDERVRKFSNTLKGTNNKNKGKTFEEIYGYDRAKKLKTDIVKRQIKKYKDPEERKKLRDYGRRGGFGKIGITERGHRYESLVEKDIMEYLENKNIEFETHKFIPNSSKISDIYLVKEEIWIEVDGINREKKKKWLGINYDYWIEKLEIYEREGLNYRIVYSVNDIANIV